MTRAAPRSPSLARTLLWCVRRELWEHRLIWAAPAIVGGFATSVQAIVATFIPVQESTAGIVAPTAAGQFMVPYFAVTGITVVAGLLVGLVYSAGALHAERRDRSILFWKSLPLSDLTIVLSKAVIPLILIPAGVFVLTVILGVAGAALQSLIWLLGGFDVAALWARLDLTRLWLMLAVGLPIMVLWYAPLYAWLLLVSAWAKRWPILWAMAPFAAALVVEHTALHMTSAHWATERWLTGGVIQTYTVGGAGQTWIHRFADLDPVRAWSHPALWTGAALAVAFLLAAARVRRSTGPL